MPNRITGSLESFKTEKGIAHGFVRLKDGELLHVAARERGVLSADGTITPCMNGDRYYAIRQQAVIILDVVYDRDGKNPYPVAWAPKP